MLTTIVGLGIVAVLLIGPVAAALARAQWVQREPRAVLVLWQALGLASGLAAGGAVLAAALAPLAGSLPSALAAYWRAAAAGDLSGGLDVFHLFLLGAAIGLFGWLLTMTAVSSWRATRCRARQRELVDLVSTPWPNRVSPARATGAGARLIDHPAAAAYCLPGPSSRVVITTGALSLLDPDELDAVLAHEHAHLAERHDLLLLPFAAWSEAMFGLAGTQRTRRAVAQLVEMLADDRACLGRDRAVLATALARVGVAGAGGVAPSGALGSTDLAVLPRVQRLLEPPAPSWWLRTLSYAAAAVTVTAPLWAFALPLAVA
ncbi:M56 family metallopeptidase [Cryptosporangium aurantiacum]|uniref:Peptidase family M48 n=1 Tax=Cryptosporangium aurantiacum TaxID=134849 RepID=A0A1M7IZN2_9ACTN|nr:M56 family metallopeptidase [Cryptosporangium aurantiacum]SHM46196.1 Peptidase family M48 [Cryptosporangium aurantiacum]